MVKGGGILDVQHAQQIQADDHSTCHDGGDDGADNNMHKVCNAGDRRQ